MKLNKNHFYLGAAALALAAATLACSLFGGGGSQSVTPTPAATVTPSPRSADYGDAPDGEDAGYYAPSGGPFLFTYDATGVQGSFPTYGRDPIPGAFTLDVDEFWIGPLFGSSGSGDIPSLENDADDPADPDGIGNLTDNGGGADCDMENGSHNPSATGCASQAAYTMPMNARLSIMFGQPPLGIWITSVTASESMTYSGPVYWNLLFDLNQDGDWEDGGEWIAQDVLVDLQPGETETLISPAFRFPTSGSPWGRLNFPYWVRSMVTSQRVASSVGGGDWDGRGPENGFEVGEVEDYFVEWSPIGQKRKNGGGGGGRGTASCIPLDREEIESLPGSRNVEDVLRLLPGVQVERAQVYGLPGVEGGGPATRWGEIDFTQGVTLQEAEIDLELTTVQENGVLELSASTTDPDGYRLILLPNLRQEGDCQGTAPVYVSTMVYSELPPTTNNYTFYGRYNVTSTYYRGDISHNPFTEGEKITEIEAEEGSIIFSGNPPFVTVEGEIDQDSGEFSADGTGIVAGYPDIAVTFEGTISGGQLGGYYTMGADGGLPGGESITYEITGTQTDEEAGEGSADAGGPLPIRPGVEDAILAFTEVFNQSFLEQDSGPLYQLLHPAVVDIYGEETCQAYLEGISDTPTSLEYQNAVWFGWWSFERDGVSRTVEDIYQVSVNFTVNEQTAPQNLHLAIPGDDSVRWFTDCGDPLTE